ncbi:uncharacterized protein LOC108344822 isoform X2 [Vigna angularis]|uniref:uncharacterized protein LOC108344822 isoform X2 n=1 Tax=Phaseolus angularis TaxID=3914 RepID=UPI000809A601|nr:uncharacterized protein LOC108344822 isoform X2 [Vigna angularis]
MLLRFLKDHYQEVAASIVLSSIDPGSTSSSTSAFTDIPFNLRNLYLPEELGDVLTCCCLRLKQLINKKEGVIVTSKVPETGLTLEPTSDAIPNRDEVQEVENKEAENVLPDNQEIDSVGSTNEEDALDPEKMRLEEAATKAQAAFRGYLIDENVRREIINHRSLRHPNIVRFKEVILTPTHLAIVICLDELLQKDMVWGLEFPYS